VHLALAAAGLAHAFGGALALAWCTERARGTIDIDVNVFVPAERAEEVAAALPAPVEASTDQLERLRRDGQVRLWWDGTPVDVFLDTTEFHEKAAARARWEDFGGHDLPFLSCADLAVFKAFFDRTKDWADLEEMAAAGTLDVDRALGVLVRYLGADDHRVARLAALA
jgi:4'-phosphopantetheinyl transferase EntD